MSSKSCLQGKVYFTRMSLLSIEQLIERYHQVDHILAGYDFHLFLIGRFHSVNKNKISVKDRAKFQDSHMQKVFLNWMIFKYLFRFDYKLLRQNISKNEITSANVYLVSMSIQVNLILRDRSSNQ